MSNLVNNAIELKTNNGDITPFTFEQVQLSPEQLQTVANRVKNAAKANAKSFKDITPIYWEAKQGESKILVFLGFKRIIKKKDGIEKPDYVCVFHDGEKEIVMGQIVMKQAMQNAEVLTTFKITCTLSIAEKAKKFNIELFQG